MSTLAAATALAAVLAVALVGGQFATAPRAAERWLLPEFDEPSGLVFHPGRGTLFLVGDQGYVAEVGLDGTLLRQTHIGGDLEGITSDPTTGHLYVVREGHEVIFELDAETFRMRRGFPIDRSFDGDANFLRRGGDGIEGLTFVPDAADPNGGRFFAVNQFDPAMLLEIAVPLAKSDGRFGTARIVGATSVGWGPLSGVTYAPALDAFVIVSALWHRAAVVRLGGGAVRWVRVPGIMPEGLDWMPGGRIAIAQDIGGVVLWEPALDQFAERAPRASDDGERK